MVMSLIAEGEVSAAERLLVGALHGDGHDAATDATICRSSCAAADFRAAEGDAGGCSKVSTGGCEQHRFGVGILCPRVER